MSAESLPTWFYPPPEDGWTAEDLDRLPPTAPERVELIDGALIFMSPQARFHSRVLRRLTTELERVAPSGFGVDSEMTIKLGKRQRPQPDIVVFREDPESPFDQGITVYQPEDVLLVVEVVSPESEVRDRETKPLRYAQAGIPHFWRIEREGAQPVVHVFELEVTTGAYVSTGIMRDRLKVDVPFPVDVELAPLAR
ncbi:restriction endonuclease [Wenjunlia vitaminophila]|uniref:Restriction endonuclease n=1 Tax=Wenjunlia vitaminophila TaxID=76728 RepID=A0A0T6LPL1_WENVI|nr:Uma2 family endonuclease [Wenjunlia vitaminophila]KRV47928.1 restriction endonuclease [Wenjunlia vitaminophila]